jgi:hypothetical protein
VDEHARRNRWVMSFEYPSWQEPLAAAILEFNPKQLPGKLEKAADAIARRIQELRLAENNEHELRALFGGLAIIRGVKRDRLESAKSQEQSL